MELEFKTFMFKPGMNMTVRRGSKWWHFAINHMEEPLTLTGPDGETRTGKILGASLIPRFNQMPRGALISEHDPACRTYDGLLSVMQQVYSGFSEEEEVTFLHFEVLA